MCNKLSYDFAGTEVVVRVAMFTNASRAQDTGINSFIL